MKHIIKEFDAVIGQTCILTALYNITLFNECKYTETDLFFLCNDLNVEYQLDLNFISNRPQINMPNLEKEANIKVNIFDITEGEEFPLRMYNILTGNNLIILFVNTSFLNYNSVYHDNINRYHAILLYGIDIENDLAYIADPHMRDYTGQMSKFQGPISLKDILAATYRFAWFDFKDKKELDKKEIFKVARANFDEFLIGKETDKKTFYGIAALKRYINDFPKLSLLDDTQLASTCLNLNYFIKICSFNYINDYLVTFIEENVSYANFDTTDVLNKCKTITLEWVKVALSLLRLGKSLRREGVSSLVEKCKGLLDIQTDVYYHFVQLLDNMKP
jgi:hypothetical protein